MKTKPKPKAPHLIISQSIAKNTRLQSKKNSSPIAPTKKTIPVAFKVPKKLPSPKKSQSRFKFIKKTNKKVKKISLKSPSP